MTHRNPFGSLEPEAPRWLALDLGSKRTGMAVSDPSGTIAKPLGVLQSEPKNRLATRIAASLEEAGISISSIIGLVVGLPLDQSGKEGQAAQEMRLWASLIADQLAELRGTGDAIPLMFVDERYSSRAANVRGRELGFKRGARKEHLDAWAACDILQHWLDAQRSS